NLMKTVIAMAFLTIFSSFAHAEDKKPQLTEEQKVLYTVGLWLGSHAAPFYLTASDLKYVNEGLRDYALGNKFAVDTSTYSSKLNDFARVRSEARADSEKKKSSSFLADAAKEKGAVKTASGLIILKERDGSGKKPTINDKVRVDYEGKLVNGKVFDSSY